MAAGQHPRPTAACMGPEGESPRAAWPKGQGQGQGGLEELLPSTTTAPMPSLLTPQGQVTLSPRCSGEDGEPGGVSARQAQHCPGLQWHSRHTPVSWMAMPELAWGLCSPPHPGLCSQSGSS